MKSLSFHGSQSQGGGGEISDLFQIPACFSASVSLREDTVNCSSARITSCSLPSVL